MEINSFFFGPIFTKCDLLISSDHSNSMDSTFCCGGCGSTSINTTCLGPFVTLDFTSIFLLVIFNLCSLFLLILLFRNWIKCISRHIWLIDQKNGEKFLWIVWNYSTMQPPEHSWWLPYWLLAPIKWKC